MALRAIRAYRTVSCEVVLSLAGMATLPLVAQKDATMFRKIQPSRNRGMLCTKAEISRWRQQALARADDRLNAQVAVSVNRRPIINTILVHLDQ